nr:immunoglobulin heavy chain junction region [Macaca mulatta]
CTRAPIEAATTFDFW